MSGARTQQHLGGAPPSVRPASRRLRVLTCCRCRMSSLAGGYGSVLRRRARARTGIGRRCGRSGWGTRLLGSTPQHCASNRLRRGTSRCSAHRGTTQPSRAASSDVLAGRESAPPPFLLGPDGAGPARCGSRAHGRRRWSASRDGGRRYRATGRWARARRVAAAPGRGSWAAAVLSSGRAHHRYGHRLRCAPPNPALGVRGPRCAAWPHGTRGACSARRRRGRCRPPGAGATWPGRVGRPRA